MEKRIYVKPELELLEFNVEAGFAVSTVETMNGGSWTKKFVDDTTDYDDGWN